MEKEEGIWLEYKKGDEQKLINSLKNKKTGWCISDFETTRSFLKYGNINIYYTKDENGNYTDPRIGIIRTPKKSAEVIGRKKGEYLEDSMVSEAATKLNSFPDKDNYIKKIKDLKNLVKLSGKINNNEQLTYEELRFIYEIDRKIETFGFGIDPRLKQIKENRNIKDDLSIAFNCSKDKIGTSDEDLKTKDLFVFYGDINLNKKETIDDYKLPPIVIGDLNCDSITSSEPLKKVEIVKGNLDLRSLKDTKFLNIKSVEGNAYLMSLQELDNLTLQTITGYIYLSENLKSKNIKNNCYLQKKHR